MRVFLKWVWNKRKCESIPSLSPFIITDELFLFGAYLLVMTPFKNNLKIFCNNGLITETCLYICS
jgi:hypothetical protein